jgi:hypothetical protein|tara:strand:- start:61 stop:516 length:456 start_codon:yes stop_codon:yes gene_type:complete
MFGLFKDNETIDIAINLSVILLKTSSVLKSIPKNKFNKENLEKALLEKGLSPDNVWTSGLGITVQSPARYLSINISPDRSGDKEDYKKYTMTLTGIQDYKGFGVVFKHDDQELRVNLLDISMFTNKSSDKYTKKAKTMFDTFKDIEGFTLE